ncbi:MAG: alpha/beta fold hydrolase, partial [Acidimicrobiia bacterium]|nr:alpha/beta fold hydrolase [Acidimicrobiia bacterium]
MASVRGSVAVTGLMAIVGLTTALGGPLQAAAAAEPDLGGTTRTITCPIEVPDEPGIEIECGQLTVPENKDDPDGSKVVLPYIVVGRSDRTPRPDPVVFTAGGPGYSSLSSVWFFANSPILDDRDVIVFEQRGNRFAQPSLVCSSMWWQEEPGNTPCLDSLRAKGVDLSQYTANILARDLIALRQALGHQQWNLYGGSFSSSLMLLLMEADQAAIRSVILQSVKPPHETAFAHGADVPLQAIEHLLAACAADDGCGAAFPELEEEFTSLVQRLNREPLAVTVTVTGVDETLPVELDGDRFVDWIMIDQLYRPVFGGFGASYLPLLVHRAADGETGVLERAAQTFWSSTVTDPNWAWGLLMTVNCQQDLPAAGDRPASDL